MKYKPKVKKTTIIFLAIVAVFFVAAHIMGFTSFRSASRIGYMETQTPYNWSASYISLNGTMQKNMKAKSSQDTFHIETETKEGSLSIEVYDSDGNLIFSESEMGNESFDIEVHGKIKVVIDADNHSGGFSIKRKSKIITETNTLSVSEIQNMKASSVLEESQLNDELINNLFYSTEITEEVRQRIWNISYKENDNISLDELRYLRVLHRGFDGNTHIGELIVNQNIAEDILDIMYELYLNDYPIEKMVLVDEYNGDDETSMEDNNTSAFNYRVVANTNSLSKHSLGMAIDINPKYNPYVVKRSNGTIMISPENGAEYADRSKEFSYKMDENDLCVKLFLEHGFTWGGNWNSVKDYQHFEK